MGSKWEHVRAQVKALKALTSYTSQEAKDILQKFCQFYFNHSTDKERENIADLLAKEGAAELLSNIIIGFSNDGFFKSNAVWFPAYYALNTVWNFTDASLNFGKAVGNTELIKYLIGILNHEPYREKQDQKNVYYLLKASLGILHNVAKVPENRSQFRQNNGVNSISLYTKNEDELLKVVSILVLGYIIDENESELIMDESGAIEILVKLLQGALAAENGRCHGYRADEIAEGLALIATCEKNKTEIYEAEAVPELMQMMESGSNSDKICALKVIWQLAFDESIRSELIEDENLMALIEKLSKSKNQEIANTAQGARWVIEKRAEQKVNNKPETESKTAGHVMISYNWDNQKTMINVKNKLQSAGFKIWMDVEDMAGSTLQAMAEAVEQATVVVIGISAKYKESPNCRTEAEYSFQLQKKILPLMMEKNYKPDGWLGAILGAKLWIDFTSKQSFEDSINHLIKELGSVIKPAQAGSDGPITASTHVPLSSKISKSVVQQWTKEEVKNWLMENKLEAVVNIFADYDGQLLCSLHHLRTEAPDFFFNCLKREMGFNSMTDILHFIYAMEKLSL
ncbi:uncharacterized protein LOC122806805 [Protopterus annectens]|uniref:uncharacterized protein LOC122806805 n=1 Tax=Protopterus annectens TaxID=7888 RepID=UPI001CFB2C30|nr:uncharacterized protein LOC122806805 [Protopterus annectens]XP_043933464.1 uncharacterized protein LOC122806805 [Protopterus annectens]XP_043933465.1 uncharacterized protein LOC122806805 [Protopterus annectens]XP_043933466.1 uncharacterized protein LOC122806805 [Protopterus annectens]